MIYLAIILFICTLAIDVATDYHRWLNTRAIDHNRGVWLRAIGLIPCISLLTIAIGSINIGFDVDHWIVFIIGWLISGLLSFAVVGFNYWNIFDGLFNLFRGYGWFFTGSDDPDDAKSDDFLQSLSLTENIIIKVGGSILFIVIYIFIT